MQLSHIIFYEQLYLSVPKEHPLYYRENVRLSELSGQTLLVRTELGVWQELIDSLKDINFVVQERKAFDQLISKFLCLHLQQIFHNSIIWEIKERI